MNRLQRYLDFELFTWILALIFLALIDPSQQQFSLCPVRFIGINCCPGCGIGHSISYLLKGDFGLSFESNKAGSFALIVIISRIFKLIPSQINRFRNLVFNK